MSDRELDTCGCCEGEERLTPADTYNRPGLDALAFRVGTHAAFFKTMIADLAQAEIAFETLGEDGKPVVERIIRPLKDLKTRRRDDFSIALLDAWATIADVLTFYQERIANEGYLRTATERRSILELARLVGYELRPGVAASTYLSFIVEEAEKPALIPRGTRAQSIPAPGETMQSFETLRDLEARHEYNQLSLRLAQPQFVETPENVKDLTVDHLPDRLYLPGLRSDLQPSNCLLLAFGKADENGVFSLGENASYFFARVRNTNLLVKPERTAVNLHDITEISNPRAISRTRQPAASEQAYYRTQKGYYLVGNWSNNIAAISSSGAVTNQLPESISGDASNQDVNLQGAAALNTQFASNIYTAMDQEIAALADGTSALRALVALPIRAYLHGHNAPLKGATKEVVGKIIAQETLDAISEVEKAAISGINDTVLEDSIKANIKVVTARLDFSDKHFFETMLSEWELDDTWKDLFSQTQITLNGIYEQIGANDLIVLAWPKNLALYRVTGVDIVSTSLFNVPATATRLQLKHIKGTAWDPTNMAVIRSTTVYSGNEFIRNPVPYRILAEKPLDNLLGQVIHVVKNDKTYSGIANLYGVLVDAILKANHLPDDTNPESNPDPGRELVIPIPITGLEFDGIVDGLKPGRWLAISGMRADIPVIGREVALIESVKHDFAKFGEKTPLPGDLRHTFVTLATGLNHSYLRDTVRVSANVVPATHGETARGVPPNERDVILGSGNAALPNQQFALPLPAGKRLTYLSAPTRDGIESTLEARVNDVLWRPVRTFAGATPTERVYRVQTNDDGRTRIVFGDGLEGARPPTGRENVRARYRIGIGKDGNVKAGQISLLATRPSGVKEVINWVAATGGTDPESRDQARGSVKFSIRTLDRLVGLQDYQDFARTFAGIGKARAFLDGNDPNKLIIYVAGEDNAPLAQDGDLIQNLKTALDNHDGSNLTIDVKVFTPRLISLDPTVTISPDYLWEKVQPAIHTKLVSVFGFARRDLGQDLFLSELIAAIQGIAGVVHVQITRLEALTEEELLIRAQGLARASRAVDQVSIEMPENELAFIDPAVPYLIILSN